MFDELVVEDLETDPVTSSDLVGASAGAASTLVASQVVSTQSTTLDLRISLERV